MVMIRSTVSNFFCKSSLNLSLLRRFVWFVSAIFFSTTVFANQYQSSDSTQSKMILKMGAEIYSSDNTFNQKLINTILEIKDVSISYVNDRQAISLQSKRSAVHDDKITQILRVEENGVTSRNLKKKITDQMSKKEYSEKRSV